MDTPCRNNTSFAILSLLAIALSLGVANCDTRKAKLPPAGMHEIAAEARSRKVGKKLYLHYCAACHGTDGKGKGFNIVPTSLKPYPRNFVDHKFQSGTTDEVLFNVISRGGRGVGRSPLMPPWGKTLQKKQIYQIIDYLRHLPALASEKAPGENQQAEEN